MPGDMATKFRSSARAYCPGSVGTPPVCSLSGKAYLHLAASKLCFICIGSGFGSTSTSSHIESFGHKYFGQCAGPAPLIDEPRRANEQQLIKSWTAHRRLQEGSAYSSVQLINAQQDNEVLTLSLHGFSVCLG